jgi:GNAT superfamily N-acetyltransferase
MTPSFTLRELTPDDGPKMAALSEQTPDTGAVAFHNIYHYDTYASTMALHPNVTGVVVETPHHEGIIGLGMMSTGQCQFEGDVRPFAYLFSLSVHPDYRRQGIATQIALWRVEKAREMLGAEAVFFAGIQQGNEGSLRNAAKWSTQRIDNRTTAGVVKVRTSPPDNPAALEVRPADKDEYEEIVHKQNAFYRDYNLYPPRSAESLYAWHQAAPFGFPLREYYVVVDKAGNLLGGLSATEEGRVTSGHVVKMAWPLRLLNYVVHLIPADGVTKRIHVKDVWFAPDRLDAGCYLWESLRWLWRERGTMVMSFFDVNSSLAQVIKSPPYMPPQTGSLVVAAPTAMNEEKCIYMHI